MPDSSYSDLPGELPKRLFHYTSIESLALILKNKTIRLNPLTKMDDLQEAKAKSISGLARYVFVSCWTDNQIESIPMWNMYAGLNNGVRIEMQANPFRKYSYSAIDVSMITGIPLSNISIEGEMVTFMPLEDMRRAISPALLNKSIILRKVTYTDDIDLLEPELLEHDSESLNINLGLLGSFKNMSWAFQSEWRYVLNFIPGDLFGDVATSKERFEKGIIRAIDCSEPPLMDHYDLQLDDDAINNMTVTLSPKLSAGNRILIDSLLKQYGLSHCLSESALRGLI